MSTLGVVLYDVLFVFFVILLARVVMEFVFTFARSYEPRGAALLVLEFTFTVTDPPVKGLRRVIPPLRLGSVALDLAILVLFILLLVAMQLVRYL